VRDRCVELRIESGVLCDHTAFVRFSEKVYRTRRSPEVLSGARGGDCSGDWEPTESVRPRRQPILSEGFCDDVCCEGGGFDSLRRRGSPHSERFLSPDIDGSPVDFEYDDDEAPVLLPTICSGR
jgi:hypothetical protein